MRASGWMDKALWKPFDVECNLHPILWWWIDTVWAKFESFFSHIVNKHANLPYGIFNKCVHGEAISDRRWLAEDRHRYIKCNLVPRAIVVQHLLYCNTSNQWTRKFNCFLNVLRTENVLLTPYKQLLCQLDFHKLRLSEDGLIRYGAWLVYMFIGHLLLIFEW